MTFKDILVHVNADKGMTARSRSAIDLAQRYDAHLTGRLFRG
jgi:hypothetical protein